MSTTRRDARPTPYPPPTIAAFVTPHGFGHAARTSAILEELHRLRPEIRIHLFTTTPDWFFADSLTPEFTLHRLVSDVGLVQRSSIEEDPRATAEALDGYLPFGETLPSSLSDLLHRIDCRLVLADISPLGLAVADRAGVESVLVESFTWDWIYSAYFAAEPRLRSHAARIGEINALCDLRIQTEPACLAAEGAVQVPPVSRSPKSSRSSVRRRLRIGADRPLVLLTMGGVRWSFDDLEPLRAVPEAVFVIPGASDAQRSTGNLRLLPHRSTFHHADLVAAADTLVGKLGYSTVAEAYRAGAPFLYLRRPVFPEGPHLASFVETHLPAREITPDEFATHAWLSHLPDLLTAPRSLPTSPNGAKVVARILSDRLDRD